MSSLTITVRTENGGNVEVEEFSGPRRAFQVDSDLVAELLERAAAKGRATYGIETTTTKETR